MGKRGGSYRYGKTESWSEGGLSYPGVDGGWCQHPDQRPETLTVAPSHDKLTDKWSESEERSLGGPLRGSLFRVECCALGGGGGGAPFIEQMAQV